MKDHGTAPFAWMRVGRLLGARSIRIEDLHYTTFRCVCLRRSILACGDQRPRPDLAHSRAPTALASESPAPHRRRHWLRLPHLRRQSAYLPRRPSAQPLPLATIICRSRPKPLSSNTLGTHRSSRAAVRANRCAARASHGTSVRQNWVVGPCNGVVHIAFTIVVAYLLTNPYYFRAMACTDAHTLAPCGFPSCPRRVCLAQRIVKSDNCVSATVVDRQGRIDDRFVPRKVFAFYYRKKLEGYAILRIAANHSTVAVRFRGRRISQSDALGDAVSSLVTRCSRKAYRLHS